MSRSLKLNEQEVMTIIEGTLKQFVRNPDYYRHSSVGPRYSEIYTEGERALLKIMEELLPLLSEAQEKELDDRARRQVLDELKGN